MTQVRRVIRTSDTQRTARPEAAEVVLPREVEQARTAVVTPLFPDHRPSLATGSSPVEAAQITNIFADLADDIGPVQNTPLARARARVAKRLPGAHVPTMSNIFVEDFTEISEDMMAGIAAKLKANPRKMEQARAALVAAHEERNARAKRLQQVGVQQVGRVAAGLALVATVLHLAPIPHA
jgi:hypothetical protein